MIRVVRWSIGAVGVLVGLFGAKLLLDLGTANLVATGKWAIGGVVLHDAVAGPLTILVAVVAARLLRRPLSAPVIVGFIVLATVTVTAYPVLGRFGARPDNPTLLDRGYTAGWCVLAGLTLLLVVLALLRGRRTAKGAARGTRPGR